MWLTSPWSQHRLPTGFTVCSSPWSRRFHGLRSDDENPRATDSVSLLCHLASVVKLSSIPLFLHLSLAGCIIATVSSSTCLSLTSSISSQSKMLQQDSFSTWDVVITSPTCLSAFIGSTCWSKLRSRWRRWRLHVSTAPYLMLSFICVADMPHRRRLRSASTGQLDVPTCRRSTVGGRAFPVAEA